MILALLIACASPRRGEPIVGPLALDDAAVRGERVFMRNCSQCHPAGEAGLGPSLNDRILPAFLVRMQVRLGLGQMPAFSTAELADRELGDVCAYLLALRRRVPAEPTPEERPEKVSTTRSP